MKFPTAKSVLASIACMGVGILIPMFSLIHMTLLSDGNPKSMIVVATVGTIAFLGVMTLRQRLLR